MLDVLNDDKKRAEFTSTLEAIANAVPAADPKPAVALPLAPDSLGAQVVDRIPAASARRIRAVGSPACATIQR